MSVALKRIYIDIDTEVHDVLIQAAKDRQTSKKAIIEKLINDTFGGNTDGSEKEKGDKKAGKQKAQRKTRKC